MALINTKNLYLLCGASGTGKTTVANMLEQNGYRRARTATTRPIRPGEREDTYLFLSKEEFLARTDFIEMASYAGNMYGCPLGELEQSSLCILEPQGIKAIRELYCVRPIKVIQLLATAEEIIERLERRTDEAIKRVRADVEHFDISKIHPDVVVWTTSIQQTFNTVCSYIELCETGRN